MPQNALAIVNQSSRWKPRIIEKWGGLSAGVCMTPTTPRPRTARAAQARSRRHGAAKTDVPRAFDLLRCAYRPGGGVMGLRRDAASGGTYFFTVVTCDRMPYLTRASAL